MTDEPFLRTADLADKLGMSIWWMLDQFKRWERDHSTGLPGYRWGGVRGPVHFLWSEVTARIKGETPDEPSQVADLADHRSVL